MLSCCDLIVNSYEDEVPKMQAHREPLSLLTKQAEWQTHLISAEKPLELDNLELLKTTPISSLTKVFFE